jgi:dihydroorotase-like cyclic amidohydrolase
MSAHELTIRNGTIVNSTETFRGDLGVAGGRIVAVAEQL